YSFLTDSTPVLLSPRIALILNHFTIPTWSSCIPQHLVLRKGIFLENPGNLAVNLKFLGVFVIQLLTINCRILAKDLPSYY
ncbi:MAG TPA: hypothetical protein VEL11_08830, partial [Candidatus Bathyarchaeia archaeon]|nr:hypothetical protein [Candidatus Bathyarchaeia archaeon]